MSDKFDNKTADLLKTVVEHFDKEDRIVRERQVRHYKELKLYWNSFSRVYWSEVAHDYKIYDRNAADSMDQDYYDKPVNIFRALLETIIAALSVQVPAITCVPDDADSPLDNTTAKAGDNISKLIYKHNDVLFLWIQALYVYCTEGMIACYNYPDEDEKYGTYGEPKYKDEEIEAYVCPNCGARQPDDALTRDLIDEFQPDPDAIEFQEKEQSEGSYCTECAQQLDPNLQKSKLTIPRLVGITQKPKSRVCLDVYGGLYIKIAQYAKKQKDTPYLIFSYETHYVNALEAIPDLRDRFPNANLSGRSSDDYEAQARQSTQYRGEESEENVTVRNTWLRPSAFNILHDEDYKFLKKKYPKGIKVVMVNDIVADYTPEALDDYWTLTRNPTSDFLNHDPLGEIVTNIQDIINDFISLSLQTVEHGIPQTWADPAVVNFAAQQQIEATPGTLTPTKPVSASKNISEAFFATKAAALAPEVVQLFRIFQELGQFVTGALPSLFGGQVAKGASKTASEYAMSRSGALQRLQTPWKMLTIWWKEIFGKAIPMYIKNLKADEKFVRKTDMNKFENVFIRKTELEGKIGDVELESAEQLPVSDEQMKDTIMQLMQLNNQEIMAALMSPDNIPMIRKVIKIPQFKIPGEDDRQKQYEEINVLINTTPIQAPPVIDPAMQAASVAGDQNAAMQMSQAQPVEMPSVEVDPIVDNHQIESDICRSWLVSEAGRLCKIENPEGYKNVLLHMKGHMDILQQQQMQQMQQQLDMQLATGAAKGSASTNGNSGKSSGGNKPPQAKKQNSVTGESDVRTPVGS